MLQRRLIHITGVVQGVGFRPFVYKLAQRGRLCGWVRNDSGGVHIDIEGAAGHIDVFIQQLEAEAPQLSRIENIHVASAAPCQQQSFRIIESRADNQVSVAVPADQAICGACASELFDKHSRYYHYPFINCTNCGPRFSIIRRLPYDRRNTSMQAFALCPDCAKAYHNPLDRRYHAEPVSCDACGPFVTLRDGLGKALTTHDAAIEKAADALVAGQVIAVKGLGGFHLVCDAGNEQAVQKLRALKRRRSKPLAIMAAASAQLKPYVYGQPQEWQALTSQAAPIVLMQKYPHGDDIAPGVAPHVAYLGVMLAYTPLHLLLFDAMRRRGGYPLLVMTSANLSGLPLATVSEQVVAQFGQQLDAILDHNRPIVNACDDSIVHYAGGKIRTLRLGRGYGPLRMSGTGATVNEPLMALGAQQKSSVAFACGEHWMLSPYLGTTDNIDTQLRFEYMVHYFPALYRTEVKGWVHDAHPGYYSSQFAAKQQGAHLSVQHHYAHLLAVLAEHNIGMKVIGFAFDGTGQGDDNSVWGGEVLLADAKGYQRVAYLRPFRLIGGEQAIAEPARILLALLLECMGLDDVKALKLKAFNHWSDAQFANLYQLWQSGAHSPQCSSVGRLFDAWASLLGLVTRVEYEGQSGLVIEHAALMASANTPALVMRWNKTGQLDWQEALLASVAAGQSPAATINISYGLISALADSVVVMARRYSRYDVALSGGVFQNRLLLNKVMSSLAAYQQACFSGEKIPANDGGIAAGQLWFAMHNQQWLRAQASVNPAMAAANRTNQQPD